MLLPAERNAALFVNVAQAVGRGAHSLSNGDVGRCVEGHDIIEGSVSGRRDCDTLAG